MPKRYSKNSLVLTKYFSHQISITGDAGAGTSTLLRNLKEVLGEEKWSFQSAGGLMRHFAAQMRMTPEEFSRYRKEHPEEKWDKRCDDIQIGWGLRNYIVVDGRLSHIFLPFAFHVKVTAPLETRAQRRHSDPAYSHLPLEEVVRLISTRDETDCAIYNELYPGYDWPLYDYDCVLNSQELNPTEMVAKVLETKRTWDTEKRDRLSYLTQMV